MKGIDSSRKKRQRNSPEQGKPAKKGEMEDDRNFAKYMAGFSQLLDDRLKDVATKQDIRSIKEEMGKLVNENATLRSVVNRIQEENVALRKQIEDIDRKVRKNNLVIKGVPAGTGDLVGVTEKVLGELINANQVLKIQQTSRLGPGDAPILVELENNLVIPTLLKNASRLKNSGVSISKDMSPAARVKCNRMLKLRWLLKTRLPNIELNMRMVYDKLQINGRVFEWVAEDLKCGNEEGLASLRKVVGQDVTEIVAELKNFGPSGGRRKEGASPDL